MIGRPNTRAADSLVGFVSSLAAGAQAVRQTVQPSASVQDERGSPSIGTDEMILVS